MNTNPDEKQSKLTLKERSEELSGWNTKEARAENTSSKVENSFRLQHFFPEDLVLQEAQNEKVMTTDMDKSYEMKSQSSDVRDRNSSMIQILGDLMEDGTPPPINKNLRQRVLKQSKLNLA